MTDFEERYYKHTKRCLILCGLWFDDTGYKPKLIHLIWFILDFVFLIPQVIILADEYNNPVILMDNVIHILFFGGSAVKLAIAIFNIDKLKTLYSKIAVDWKDIRNESERAILERYNEDGLWLSKLFCTFVFGTWLAASSKPFLPRIMNLIVPLENGTRPLLVPTYSDYVFFDQEDYIYWVIAYVTATYTYFAPFYAGYDSFFMLSVKHICGLFAVTRYRIEKAFDILEDEFLNKSLSDNCIQTKCEKNLIDAVILHNETIRSVQLLEDSFSICFLGLIGLCTMGFGMATTFLIYARKMFTIILVIVFLEVGMIFHLFCMNWMGQQLIDNSEQIFYSAYFSNWHMMHPKSRRYIHIIMTRSLYPSKLTAGKIIDISMETFGRIIKGAVSYCTVFMSLT